MIDYALIWAGLIAFAVLAYVVLDGFDLGVGILFPCVKGRENRDRMMNSVAPVWDGNETWLILGGGGLLAVFPLAYSIILPALYIPIFTMLLALVFRGVAFEFRWKISSEKNLWDKAFAGGSTVAAFSQGLILGALIEGIPVAGRAYAGGWWDWLTPFTVFTGISLVIGYALLGSTWLVSKTEGQLQQIARKHARMAAFGTLFCIAAVSLYTPFLHEHFAQRWFKFPELLYVIPVPILVVACAWALFRGLHQDHGVRAYLAAVGLFVLSYVGLIVSFFPYMIPSSVTLWEAAAPEVSLRFLLVGAVFLVPIILAYTCYSYWVFRGKVGNSSGYHG
jgi:cytochrome d ubiquinol oxidase subunit II